MTTELEPKLNVAYGHYDFAKDGGAVGDIELRGDVIPNEAIITQGKVDVETAITSGGATTIALKAEGAADLLAATAKASFSADAILNTVPDGTAANAVRTTANRKITATVAVAAITAGKFHVAVEYYMPRG